jgi:hypothetical protein
MCDTCTPERLDEHRRALAIIGALMAEPVDREAHLDALLVDLLSPVPAEGHPYRPKVVARNLRIAWTLASLAVVATAMVERTEEDPQAWVAARLRESHEAGMHWEP